MKLSEFGLFLSACFAIASPCIAATFYVNDAYTNGDVYCSARGYDTNSGNSAAFPMLTITNLLAQKDLEPGDTVYIDTGDYSNYTVSINSNDCGSSTGYVSFIGSTNLVACGSVIMPGVSRNGISLKAASYLSIENLMITSSASAVFFESNSHSNVFRHISINRANVGLYGGYQSGYGCLFQNFFVANAGKSMMEENTGAGLGRCDQWYVRDCGVAFDIRTTFSLSNSVIEGGTAFARQYPVSGDYNIFWNTDLGYDCMNSLQRERDAFWKSMVAMPLYVVDSQGFCFPASTQGRYDSGTGGWTTDASMSPVVDAGDFSCPVGEEPAPNGDILNAGTWGGSVWASKGYTNSWVRALTFNDGGRVNGASNALHWSGGKVVPGNTVSLDYSVDSGGTWIPIVGATAIPFTNRVYSWDASGLPATSALWRVRLDSNTNIWDATDQRFSLNGGQVYYYMNDSSTADDIYCTTVGNDANTGIAPNSPVLTFTNLLDSFSLHGNVTVLVDAGYYSNQTFVITGDDDGWNNFKVVWQGHTNVLAGKTIIKQSGLANGLSMLSASYNVVTGLAFRGGRYGAGLTLGSDYNEFIGCLFFGANFAGLFMEYSGGNYNTIRRSVFDQNVRAIYLNTTSGTGVSYVDGCTFYSNSIHLAVRDALAVSNCVFYGRTFLDTAYDNVSGSSDFNVFYDVAFPQDTALRSFQEQQGGWWHCTVADPLFADAASGDFHPKSTAGRYDPTTSNWVYDAVTSPLVDFGDPSDDYSSEPSPNGSNVNAGAFGNTRQASKSPSGLRLMALSFNDGGALDVPGGVIYWRALNAVPSDRVKVEISLNGGNDWVTAATNVSALDGNYAWTFTNGLYSSDRALWRVVSEGSPTVASTNSEEFYFHYGSAKYYLNDSNTVGDIYTTAVGRDTNTGLTTNDPKYSIASLLADSSIHIRGGDVIYADTGVYSLSTNATLSSLVITDVTERVSLIGSTNSLNGGTVWLRQTNTASAYVLAVSNVGYMAIQNVQFKNAGTGIRISGCGEVSLDRVVCAGNSGDGLQIIDSQVACEYSVFQGNSNAGINIVSGRLLLTNSIISAEAPLSACFSVPSTTNVTGNYNDYFTTNGAVVAVIASTNRNADSLSAWTYWTASDSFSLSVNPLFVSPTNHDYHLRSDVYAGRYNPSIGWVQDSERSLLIDAGDPASDYSAEPDFNGRRVNIGLFGGTSQASKGTSNAWLHCASADGGWVKGLAAMHWVAGGAATGGTVRIDYSANGGASWSTLASGLAASGELFSWDTTSTNDTPAGLWRVALMDGSATNGVTRFFAVRNNALNLYVNDASPVGDVYCSAVGSDLNYKAESNAPMATLGGLLSFVDLEAGDRVYVDTGSYTNSEVITVGRHQGGVSNSPVFILGSTSLLYRSAFACGGMAGIELRHVSGLDISALSLSGTAEGLIAKNGRDVNVRDVAISGAMGDGVMMTGMLYSAVSRTLLDSGAGRGVSLENCTNVALVNNVVWSNSSVAVYQRASVVQANNNVLTAGGTSCVYWVTSGSVPQADYNDILLWDTAQAARNGSTVIRSVVEWQNAHSNDFHSLSHDPLFAGSSSGDFHLQSTAGRLSGTNWVIDAAHSPLIDTGNNYDYSRESEPNGRRINIGIYGNTISASRSRTNGWLLALTCNNGGTIRGTNWMYWAAGGAVTGQTVTLQYSIDGGGTWSNMSAGISAVPGAYMWDTTVNGPYTCLATYWRVVSDVDTSVLSQTENSFVVNNGPLTYYVNDASTNRDVYCTAPGNTLNNGLSSNTPAASLEQILVGSALRAGDAVYMDTGSYTQQSACVFSDISGTNALLIAGSTNGTVIYAAGVANAFSINQSGAFHLRDVTVKGASVALYVNGSTNIVVERVGAEQCATAFRLNNAKNTSLQNCYALGGARGFWQQGGSSSGTRIGNNVYWSNTTACISLENGSLSISNSVLSALATGDYAYVYFAGTTIAADYNDLVLQNGGYAALYDTTLDTIYATVSDWAATGKDVHSLARDPRFANLAVPDFHLRSQAPSGRYDPASGWVQDAETSPLIDAGSFVSTNEYPVSGSVVNIGLYGNTSQASRPPTNAWLTVISYDDGGSAAGTCPFYWAVGGAATGHTLAIDVSVDNGQSWSNAVAVLSAMSRAYSLDTTRFASTPLARWKIRSVSDATVFDTNTQFFSIRNQPLSFYVNDPYTNGDVYCSAIGSSANSGADPAAPLDGLSSVLSTYALRPGDTVYMDTGTYTPTSEVVISEFDYGTAGSPLVIMGSTNVAAGGTVLDRSGESMGLKLDKATGITLKHLTIKAATTPVRANDTITCSFEWVATECSGPYGFYLYRTTTTDLRHCSARGMTYGLYMDTALATTWDHGVIWAKTYGVYLNSGALTLQNSFIRVSGSSAYAIYRGASASYSGNYNGFYLENFAQMAVRVSTPYNIIYSTLGAWVYAYGNDADSLIGEPGFADGANGDFHLQTIEPNGRYVPALDAWTNDAANSMLLDAGTGSFINETAPNGGRANIGVYGDSLWASRSATNADVRVISYADGGTATGVCSLAWVATGNATGHLFRLEYSDDSGASWSTIASNVSGSTGGYAWDTSSLGTQVLSMWRIVDEDEPDVSDSVTKLFTVRNGPAYYYVNDTEQEGDIYTTAIGSVLNDGTKSWKPKFSVQEILDAYDIEPGDIIYVDTGTNTAGFAVGQQDAGSAANPVLFQGSTNEQFGGTVFTAGVTVKQAPGIALRHFNFKGASTAVAYSDYSSAGQCEWVRIEDGSIGFSANGQNVSLDLDHCSVLDATSQGVYVQNSAVVSINHAVLWNNRYGINVNAGNCRITNSVVGVAGASRYAYYLGTSGTIIGDYNNITATNGAMFGYRLTSRLPVYYERLSDWVSTLGYESHSMSMDPLFASPEENDFHLRSQHADGRYVVSSGGWTQDVETSHLVDAGLGVYTNEPSPNGLRANIGLYGNSTQASRTPTNAWLQVVSLQNGGRVSGTHALLWNAGGSVTGHLCKIEFSGDGGTTWQLLAGNVAANLRSYMWDSTKHASTPRGMWRITSENDPAVFDQSQAIFSVRNAGRLSFFVNDDSTVGDVYTTAIGSSANPGDSSNAPLDSVQTVLDDYDLEPGDIIYVDTGTNSDVITWGFFDSGTNKSPVVLQGSTNEAFGGTVMMGRLSFSQAPYVYTRHLTFAGSGVAISYGNYSDSGTCEWVRVFSGTTGIEVNNSTGITAIHCVLDGLTAQGIYCTSAGNMGFRSGVIRNCRYAVNNNSSTVALRNNVIEVTGSNTYAYYLSAGTLTTDYNAIHLANGAMAGWKSASPINTRYDTVGNWSLLTGQDSHSPAIDPLLINASAGNYHEQTNSPLINAGNPADEYDMEPSPNGARINIGCYGNTAEAATTPSAAGAVVVSLADGGRAAGTNTLYWTSWNVGQVHLDYSADGGATWQRIATGIDSSSGSATYDWNTLSSTSSPAGLWRILNAAGGAVLSQTTNYFALRNEALEFYVNDTNTVGDMYCSAAGKSTNLGISANAPSLTLNHIFDTYDLEGGDTIYVDTGFYMLSASVSIGYFDRGSRTNPVTVQGSTQYAHGGSFMQGQPITVSEAEGISLKNLSLRSGGVSLSTAYYAELNNLILTNNSTGISLANSHYALIHGCILHGNTRGISVATATGSKIHNNTFANNTSYCIQGDNRSDVTVENNVFHLATNIYCYSGAALYATDYNLYDFPGAELMCFTNGIYPSYTNFTSWQVARGHDYRSAVTNALFATNAVDYHLQSTKGTYHSGSWDLYSSDSWGIDGGSFAYDYSVEPAPNGSRINIGAYGDTSEASKGGSNLVLAARLPRDIDVITSSPWPVVWRANRIPESNSLLLVEYSSDSGANWNAIATAPATNEYVLWTVPVALTGQDIRWRLLDAASSGLVFSVTNDGPVQVLLEYADLELTVTRTPSGSVNLFNTNVFTITLHNNGPFNSTNIKVYDRLTTNGLDYVGHSSSYDYDPLTGLWSIDALNAGSTATMTLYAKTMVTATNLTNLVVLSSYSPWDPNVTNNTSFTNFYVANAADVGVTKSVSQSSGLTNNQPITFSLLVTNAGPDLATNVVVLDLLPKFLRYDSHVGDNYAPETGLWSVGTIAKGEVATLIINATITNDGIVIVNTAAVQQVGRPYDQNPANNISAVSLNVGTTPAIAILGTNMQLIAKGDFSPNRTNGTDYGWLYTASGQTNHRFVVTNSGSGDLIISNIVVSGSDFTMTNTPSYPLTVSSHGAYTLGIRFDPVQAGTRTSIVSVLNNADTPYVFGLRGTGVSVSAISLRGLDGSVITNGSTQPDWGKGTDLGSVNIAFGARTNLLVITNSGDAALTITGIQTNTSHTGEFSIENPGTIAVNSSAVLRVIFNPSVETVRTAQVVLVNNSAQNPAYSFVLRGTGITESVMGVLGADGSLVTNGTAEATAAQGTYFGDTDINGGVTTNILTITNGGNGLLLIENIYFDGAAGTEFHTIAPIAPISVLPGAVTNLVVTFNPDSPGDRDAVIYLSNNDADQTPYHFNLRGSAIEDVAMAVLGTNGNTIVNNSITVSPADGTDFGAWNIISGAKTQTFTITNAGTADLTISGYAITNTGAGAFSLSYPPTVSAGTVSNFLVSFDPDSEILYTADIILTNNSPKNPYRFRVQGTGITSAIIAVLGTNGLVITNHAAATPARGTDFGSVDIHGFTVTNCFRITNSGNRMLSVSNVLLTGGQPEAFTVVSWPSNVAVGGVSNLLVAFNPAETNTYETTLQINSDGNNQPVYQFALRGTGSERFEMAVLGTNGTLIPNNSTSPSVAQGTDFGALNLAAAPVTHVLRITNSGTGMLTISDVQRTGTGYADFTLTWPTNITAGSVSNLSITFHATAEGMREANLVLVNNASNYAFVLRGTGVVASIAVLGVNGSSISNPEWTPSYAKGTDFGSVGIVSPITNRLVITNAGSDVLQSTCTLQGGNEFSLIAPPTEIQPRSSAPLYVRFHPNASGIYTACVTVVNSTTTNTPYLFALKGTGTLDGISIEMDQMVQTGTGTLAVCWQGPYGLAYQIQAATPELSNSTFSWYGIYNNFTNRPYLTNSVVSNLYGFSYSDTTVSGTNCRLYRVVSTNSWDAD